jgi:hypothetical protein
MDEHLLVAARLLGEEHGVMTRQCQTLRAPPRMWLRRVWLPTEGS